ncbi:MAG: hypothetical protein HY507_01940 [Candidatus Zambryskibacteria bacterium]|nr:hypothetical protein [Candidatus Zambryskibacteria bacterium]
MNYIDNILGFFFGSIRRAGWTVGISTLLYFMYRPADLQSLAHRLVAGTLTPVLHMLLADVIAAIIPLTAPAAVVFVLLLLVSFSWRRARGRQ